MTLVPSVTLPHVKVHVLLRETSLSCMFSFFCSVIKQGRTSTYLYRCMKNILVHMFIIYARSTHLPYLGEYRANAARSGTAGGESGDASCPWGRRQGRGWCAHSVSSARPRLVSRVGK